MDKEIPVVLGGFGSDKRCMSDKTISEIHGITTSDIRKAVIRNLSRFKEATDFIDLKSSSCGDDLLQSLGYSKQQVIQAEHIYILSERGYAKLIKIMDTDRAWEVHDQLMDEYFHLREAVQATLENLSPELQMFKSIFDAVAAAQLAQKEQEKALENTNRRIDNISEIVALHPVSWREDARKLIVKIAHTMGGNDYIREVQKDIFGLIDQRAAVSLETRLTNKRRRMADEGVCKSKRDKLNKIDVIADDKKLIEIYVAVVKEMAVKYGMVIHCSTGDESRELVNVLNEMGHLWQSGRKLSNNSYWSEYNQDTCYHIRVFNL